MSIQRLQAMILVGLQFAISASLLLTTGWPIALGLPASLLAAGGLLMVWAMVGIGARQLNIMPEPSSHSRLVTRGPYRFIRHPMYAGLLLMTGGAALNEPSTWKLVAWISLFFVLSCKAGIEERHLMSQFADYPAYRLRTKRIIPFIW